MGRVYPILKRTSHLSIILAEGTEARAEPKARKRREPEQPVVEATEKVEESVEAADDESTSAEAPADRDKE
jgi:hypothetical protein